MSLISLFKKNSKMTLFTTPSHSQRVFLLSKLRNFYKYDISETDFHNPELALSEAQIKASKIYSTRSTYFLTNGSTSGIIASALSCVMPGEKVLIWENAHQCHKNAVLLSGAIPIFYSIPNISNWGVPAQVQVEQIECILKKEACSAVIVTSPSYEGIVSDIKAISSVTKKYGAKLIVDEAHGALYPFCSGLPCSAIYLGADFVVQSLHKTAGGLNPTALLHCCCDLDCSSALAKISTTSPSYPLLASIEKNINYLNSRKGKNSISNLLKDIEDLKIGLNSVEFLDNDDKTKVVIKKHDLSGKELSEFLYTNKIEDEKTNDFSTMLLCGIGTTKEKFLRLKKVLKKL